MPSEAEKAACQAPNDPWLWTKYYGWWTTYFILSVVIAISIVNGIKRMHNLNRIMRRMSLISFHPKVSALVRMISYPQLVVFQALFPPLGACILLFGFLTYSTLVCFLRRPFYRPPHYGGSPLGIRAEWVATAMSPWLYLTATKRNFLVYLTGVSFKRIMDFHKWAPWICLYMSILHTWTMIIRIQRQQPWHYTIIHNKLYWNGFIPLLALGWLCLMSIGPIRARFYEYFYILHMIAAIAFLIGMYIHLENVLDSWQYIHATSVFWGAGLVWQLIAYTLNHGWFRRIPICSIELIESNALRIRVPVPISRTWSAGSYVYIRFINIKPWQSHPLTIASLPSQSIEVEEGREEELNNSLKMNEMIFVLRPRDGLTGRLKSLAISNSLPILGGCLIDGPYGGFMESLRACDSVVLIGGGTGITGIITIGLSLQRGSKARGVSCCSLVELHWVIRESKCLEWFKEELDEMKNKNIYITQEDPKSCSKEEVNGIIKSYFKPEIGNIIESAAKQSKGRLGVMVCGPNSMVVLARNVIIKLQKSILNSNKSILCNEIEFYQESFD